MSPYLIEHQSSARYSSFLASVLRTIFNQILLTDAKNKHVVICESLLAPLELKRTLASILFYRFIVKSISFVPSPYVALMATGQTTGLVIDCGFKETCVFPRYSELLSHHQVPNLGSTCCCRCLFEGNEEGESLQSCLLRTLLKCPIATRTDLLQNAFVCGGTFSIPGLEDRLKYEVEHLADESPEFHNVRRLASKMNYINSPFQPSQRAWVGGSLVGSVKIKTAFDVSREEFIEHGTVPDWSMI
ncbi:hypothetical protein BASA60_008653 [Batrachochytrium salamandrivorans]|nr:hypothetical protein BASA60_008653 [Batrachochytrium salamandrivorans]